MKAPSQAGHSTLHQGDGDTNTQHSIVTNTPIIARQKL